MEEFREDIKKLEDNILKLIHEFEKEYNCYVDEINLIHKGGRMLNGELHAETSQVEVEYKLCD